MTPFQELNRDTWQTQVVQAQGPVLVDFQAPDQRTVISNELAISLNRAFGRPVRLVYADVSKLLDIVLFHRIHDLPTLCLFHQGRILKAFTGANRVEKMLLASSQLRA